MELVCSSELSRSVPAKRDLASVAESQAAEFAAAAAAAGSLVWLISAMLYLSSEIGLWVVGSEVFIGYDSFQTFNYWLASRLWGLQVVFKLTFDMDSMVCSRLPIAPGKNKAKAVPVFENKDDDSDDEEDEEEGDDEDDDGGEEDASGDEGDNKKEAEDGGDGEDAPANGEGGSEDEDDDDDEGGDDEDEDDDDGEDDEDEEEEDEDDDEDPEPPAKKRK